MADFSPIHLNATSEDLVGNGGKGRFLLLPGSRDRAASMAERLSNVEVRQHPRGHDLHLGVFSRDGVDVDVGVISTGMGCPSIDLIVSELLALGARVLLRVGTSGSLQPQVHAGDIVVATGAVRDEAASDDYLPREFPALASWPMLLSIRDALGGCDLRGKVHFGAVHTKDTLYGREFAHGPLAAEHIRYNALLSAAGVLASEMECAHLFVLSQLAHQGKLGAASKQGPSFGSVWAGAVLAVIGEHDQPFTKTPATQTAVEDAIELGFSALVALARSAVAQ